MAYMLIFKDTGEPVVCETTRTPVIYDSYVLAKKEIESYGHVGEEFITIKETNDGGY